MEPAAKRQRTESPEAAPGFPPEREERARKLLAACEAGLEADARALLAEGADAWYQDETGWSSLHYAAASGSVSFVKHLLSHGGVWNMTDKLGYTPGDIAFSLNHAAAYDSIVQEGLRTQLLQHALDAARGAEADPLEVNGEDAVAVDGENEPTVVDGHVEPSAAKTSADDNATFLQSKLRFVGEPGHEVCVDADGNGVMMAWERGIMERSANALLEGLEADEDGLAVLNVGFGLGLVDTALQQHKPRHHIIIAHVLAHMRKLGWFDKPGVSIFEGTWQAYFQAVDDGSVEARAFDAVYFDTFSEHYRDLHAFFEVVPNILRDERSRFSWFHGLGATSRTLYEVFTSLAELQLRDIGLSTSWEDVEVENGGEATWDGVVRRYWDIPSSYRLPLCRPLDL